MRMKHLESACKLRGIFPEMDDLVNSVGVGKSSIYAYFDGTRVPPVVRLKKLLEALSVSPQSQLIFYKLRDEADRFKKGKKQDSPIAIAPRELPLNPSILIGREHELTELTRLTTAGEQARTVVVSAVSGTAGVGKTALAVRWAHEHAASFPDGQLYVDLRGYDPDEPLEPTEALTAILRRLGVAGSALPQRLDDLVGLYRSLLHDKQMLVVLDNAINSEQVRPLLPGTTTCFVVITSRDSLSGLVAQHNVHRVELDLLSLDEAVALLRVLVGPRIDADLVSTERLVQLCARLPLALRVAAEVVNRRKHESLSTFVDELDQYQHRLAVLDVNSDPRMSVKTVFSWSYRNLDVTAARMFCLLGLYPGLGFSIHAAAALFNDDLVTVRLLLDRLVAAHLIEQPSHRRFRMHELLRDYATELFESLTEADWQSAWRALIDHYRWTATKAMDLVQPHEKSRRPTVLPARTLSPEMSNAPDAHAWLEVERTNLLALVTRASRLDRPRARVTDLAAIIWRYLDIGGYYRDAHILYERSLVIARAEQDEASEGALLAFLGMSHYRQTQLAEAVEALERSIEIRRRIGDLPSAGAALNTLGLVLDAMGNTASALSHLDEARDIARQVGNKAGEAGTLNNIATILNRFGRSSEALDHLHAALQISEELGDKISVGRIMENIGNINLRIGNQEEGVSYLQRSLALAEELKDRRSEALALCDLGSASVIADDPSQALLYFDRAIQISSETGDRDLEMGARNKRGDALRELGRLDDAYEEQQRALDICLELGEQPVEVEIRNDLGATLCDMQVSGAAQVQYEAALELARGLGVRYEEARALDGLAQIALAGERVDAARRLWREALAIYGDLNAPERDRVQARLAELGQE